MKIQINARFLTQPVTGVQRYAVHLVKALDDLLDRGLIDPKRFLFVLLAPREIRYALPLKHIPLKRVGHLSGHLWEQFELPFYARGGLLLNLCNAAPLFKRNQIVTIHDASVFATPNAYSYFFRTWYKILLTVLGKTARKIMTDSSFSKTELIRYAGMDDRKIEVIALGAEHVFSTNTDETILKRHEIGRKPFVLAVGSMNPNKNFDGIVRAIERLGDAPFDIVIAGGVNPRVFGSARPVLPAAVKHLGYVNDGELRTLYEHASCFVYPSLYEGFGLPPLEAMACGCPVIVSRSASLPEVCGDAAVYCDPDDPKDIAEKITMLMNDSTLREKLRGKGMERARQFRWDRCARETAALMVQSQSK